MATETQPDRMTNPSPRPLYALSLAVSSASDLEAVYDAALQGLQESLGVTQSSVLLFDAGGVMRFTAWRELSEPYRNAVEGHSPWTPDARDPQPVLVPDVTLEPSLAGLRDVIEAEGIRALAFIPLVA